MFFTIYQPSGLALKVSNILEFFNSQSLLSRFLLQGDFKIIKRDDNVETFRIQNM